MEVLTFGLGILAGLVLNEVGVQLMKRGYLHVPVPSVRYHFVEQGGRMIEIRAAGYDKAVQAYKEQTKLKMKNVKEVWMQCKE
jgi:hypothetical protein